VQPPLQLTIYTIDADENVSLGTATASEATF